MYKNLWDIQNIYIRYSIIVRKANLYLPSFPELLMPLSKKRKKTSSDVSPNGDGARKK